MHTWILIFVFVTLVLSSKVHFECNDTDSVTIEAFKHGLNDLISSRKYAELDDYLLANESMKYSQFLWLEETLQQCLEENLYVCAYTLIDFGIRITHDFQVFLMQVINRGDSELLEFIIETHMTTVTMQVFYEDALLYAADVSGVGVLDVLLAFDNLMEQCPTSTMTILANKCLENGKTAMLESILKACEPRIKKQVLRTLIKISALPDRFFIVKMGVDENVLFLGIENEILFEILLIAARLGCVKTTNKLLKIASLASYVKLQMSRLINPSIIAQEHGHDLICDIYKKLGE